MKIRASFGRYDLGADEKDERIIKHMDKLEKEAVSHGKSAHDAFRELIERDMGQEVVQHA